MIKTRSSTARNYTRGVLSGLQNTGKTTAATKWCENPIWIDLDDRIPSEVGPQTIIEGVGNFDSIKGKLKELRDSVEFPWDGLVLDTVTILESIARDHSVLSDFGGNVNNYSSFSTGDKFNLPIHINTVLSLLDQIAKKHSCDILLICHSSIKPEKNPNGDNYDKVKLDLTDKVRARILQWADMVGFIWDDVSVVNSGIGKKASGESVRRISFNNDPRYDAKGPYNLPTDLVFDIDGSWVIKVKECFKAKEPVLPTTTTKLVEPPITKTKRTSL